MRYLRRNCGFPDTRLPVQPILAPTISQSKYRLTIGPPAVSIQSPRTVFPAQTATVFLYISGIVTLDCRGNAVGLADITSQSEFFCSTSTLASYVLVGS